MAPVVLLHALGGTRADWDGVSPDLAAAGRPVHAWDLRGHGDAPWVPPYTLERMCDDVLAAMDAHGLDQVDLVGHSLGGAVASLLASHRPERVRRLVLEDVGVLRPRTPAPATRPTGRLAYDWEVVSAVRRQLDDPDPGWRAGLTRITAATLVIAGGPDSHVPGDTIDELVVLVPDARAVTIPVGHLVHSVAPREWLDVVRPFLS